MEQKSKEILKLMLDFIAFERCQCSSEWNHADCPIHGWETSHYLYKEIKEKIETC